MIDAKPIDERFREYFSTLSLSDLRTFGRFQGVRAATQLKKEALIEEIVNVLTGKTQPVFPKTEGKPVGAPPKNFVINPDIMPMIEEIRRKFDEDQEEKEWVMRVASGEKSYEDSFDAPVYLGILELMPSGYGFVRCGDLSASGKEDVFIPAHLIHSLQLRHGDYVSCTARPSVKNEPAVICNLLTVNKLSVGRYERRPHFDALTAQYPDRKIQLSANESALSLRILDLFAPIGMGQRGLIIAPSGTGKTDLLKDIARSVSAHYKDISLIALLIDARPEEVTDFTNSAGRAEILYSTFEESAQRQVRVAELALEHAKRMAEQGADVMLLLDSVNKLARAYNALSENAGGLAAGLDVNALKSVKRFFAAARNTLEAGSVTILATALSDSGSGADGTIKEEFQGTGNAEIVLSRELAEKRIFPAIDLRRSGTRKEELLLSEKELGAARKLRELGDTDILDMFRKTADNDELIARLSELKKS